MMDQIQVEFDRWMAIVGDNLQNVLVALGLTVAALVIARLVSEFVRKRVDNSKIGAAANREAMGPGNPSLGKSLGAATFWLIILFFIPMILDNLGLSELLAPLNNMMRGLEEYFPRVVIFGIVVSIGFVIATVALRAVTSLLSAAPIDHAAQRGESGDLIKGKEIARSRGSYRLRLHSHPDFHHRP